MKSKTKNIKGSIEKSNVYRRIDPIQKFLLYGFRQSKKEALAVVQQNPSENIQIATIAITIYRYPYPNYDKTTLAADN